MHFSHYTIRLIAIEDLEDYFSLIQSNRQRLEDFFAGTVAITKTLEKTKTHLGNVIMLNQKKNYYSFVVIDDTTHKLIASLQVKNMDWSIPKAELGYYIDKSYEGKGVITKALSFIGDFCFNELGLAKLYIRTHESNTGSIKVAEKNGFLLEGIIRKDYKTTKGELVDLLYYGLVNPKC